MGRLVTSEEFFMDDRKGAFIKSESIGLDGFTSVVRADYKNGWVTYDFSLKNCRTTNHVYYLHN